ncbi:bile acid:sodium symporter [Hyphomicrobium sp. CS1GBMeth3]|uniref:arsenic resistance protein n=1 Tax=Hyphomicrobium sp. CS1GBMeth3 TaxID=1892845 RepID=UPI000931CB32|nr:bile acid:sodium symporter [Hyphomicrobium sp. CS1GBMeth3]
MQRETLERHQVWVYLAAIVVGLVLGSVAPGLAPILDGLLWPSLAALLYVTFTQVPLAHLPAAFRDLRFITAVLGGNFLLLPVLVWGLLALVPDDRAVRLGVLLVLLVPCTDWFITFTHQARGDVRRAIAVTPVVLVVQIVLLPLYLWLFMGEGFAEIVSAGHMTTVFVVVIVAPLALAYLTERWAERALARSAVIEQLGWLPVPLLALVLFLIAASQVEAATSAVTLLGDVAAAFIGFLIGAAALGVLLGRVFALPLEQARTLLFSFATRNSFVVLPFALALPAGWEATAIVVVFQSMLELFGMLLFLWLVPRLLLPIGAAR